MPRLWDRSKRERRTPFSDVLADYLDAHRWMKPKNLAVDTGLSATTIQRYLNGEVTPHDPRILQQIHAGTGIPLAQLYEAAGLWLPPAPAAAPAPHAPHAPHVLPAPPVPPVSPVSPVPPTPRDLEQRRRRPRLVEGDAPHAALDDFLRRVQSFQLDDEQRRALIASVITAVAPAPEQTYWRNRIDEEHDWDRISTMVHQTVPPATTATTATPVRIVEADEADEAPQQTQESQPAGHCV